MKTSSGIEFDFAAQGDNLQVIIMMQIDGPEPDEVSS